MPAKKRGGPVFSVDDFYRRLDSQSASEYRQGVRPLRLCGGRRYPAISFTPVPPHAGTIDEIKFEQESAANIRGLELREREVAAKERELGSRWRNPIVLGLFATALGL